MTERSGSQDRKFTEENWETNAEARDEKRLRWKKKPMVERGNFDKQ